MFLLSSKLDGASPIAAHVLCSSTAEPRTVLTQGPSESPTVSVPTIMHYEWPDAFERDLLYSDITPLLKPWPHSPRVKPLRR